MTEAAYQAARKLMQRANYLRGKITDAKGNVAKWTSIESARPSTGSKRGLDKALTNLEQQRSKFASLKFPDNDLKEEENRCNLCGRKIKLDELCQCIYE